MWLQLVVGWCVGSPLVAVLVGKMMAGPRLVPVAAEPVAAGFGASAPSGAEFVEPLVGGVAQAA